jgi:homoserine kinase
MIPWAQVRVPATTANLGPGFDCLGLALNLWNEAEFHLEGQGLSIEIEGEGAHDLPRDSSNAIFTAFRHFVTAHQLAEPAGLAIHCHNHVPTASGLGSSATALLLGLLGANALYGSPASRDELLTLAADLEGHADNAAPALYGGLVVSFHDAQGWLVRCHPLPTLTAVVVLPDFNLPTQVARQALPACIAREDAIFNLARTPVVVEALQQGDLALLARAMQDRLHQPYRSQLIPGARTALEAAHAAGAQAAALSGAGPSLIAFCTGDATPAAQAMQAAFTQAGLASRTFILHSTNLGAQVNSPAGPLP